MKIVLVISMLLAVCLATKSSESKEDGCVCTEQYDPVCGFDGKIFRTYGNICRLNCDCAEFVHKGPCGRGGQSHAESAAYAHAEAN